MEWSMWIQLSFLARDRPPLLLSAVGNELLGIMIQRGATWLDHYIDDFVTMGSPGSLRVC